MFSFEEQFCYYTTQLHQKKKYNKYIPDISNRYNYFTSSLPLKLPKYNIPKDLIQAVMKNSKSFTNITLGGKNFLNILEEMKECNKFQMDENNYLKIFHLLLYIEEIQNQLNFKKYDQLQRIQKLEDSIRINININKLIQKGLPIKIFDRLILYDFETKHLFYTKIQTILDDHIIVTCKKQVWNNLISKKLYKIRFQFHNYSLKCCHYALTLIKSYELIPYFFPNIRGTCNKQMNTQHWFNKHIENNPEQKQAVIKIVCKSSFPAPYILYGPPGTGKTSTLVEAICQIWYNNPSEHILICTSSNIAGDVITKQLLRYIPKHNMCRMYSSSKNRFDNDLDILECSNYFDGHVIMLPKEIILLKKIIICTLCASLRLLFLNFRETHFSYVFIDEAGQVTEPNSMIPFSLLSSTKKGRIGQLHGQVIIAGDPQQLGPFVSSKLAEPILGKSILVRLMNCEPYKKNEQNKYNPNYITKLCRNYRSHPIIIHVSNKLFYDNELLAYGDESIRIAEEWKHLAQSKFPMIFHGVNGNEIKNIETFSSYNMEEIKIVMHYVKILIGQPLKERNVTENDIGIITPFSEQKRKIDCTLEKERFTKIDVGTVEFFQGQEKNIIILSSVRSKVFTHNDQSHIGFLSNPKRLNVALTRAKALLIIIGNPIPLLMEKHWCYLLNFCKRNNACRGMDFSIKNYETIEI